MKYKLIVFDMDGVIFQHDNFWQQMHEKYDTIVPGLELTKKYLEKDTHKLAKLVIGGLWKGKPAEGYLELIKKSRYNPGVKGTVAKLKKQGIKTMILTSGPKGLAERAQKELGVDYVIANELFIENDMLTGKYNWKLEFHGKGEVLEEFCRKHKINMKNVVAVGDNDNDVSKAKIVGLAIAFNSKSEKLKKVSDVIIEGNDLREIIKYI